MSSGSEPRSSGRSPDVPCDVMFLTERGQLRTTWSITVSVERTDDVLASELFFLVWRTFQKNSKSFYNSVQEHSFDIGSYTTYHFCYAFLFDSVTFIKYLFCYLRKHSIFYSIRMVKLDLQKYDTILSSWLYNKIYFLYNLLKIAIPLLILVVYAGTILPKMYLRTCQLKKQYTYYYLKHYSQNIKFSLKKNLPVFSY